MISPEQIQVIAEAEKVLNRTLAYQAAIAVHELKDRLNVDVAEIRLRVAPFTEEHVGAYRVTCTIAALFGRQSVLTDVSGLRDEISARDGNGGRDGDGRAQATGK